MPSSPRRSSPLERRSTDPFASLFGDDSRRSGDRWRPAVDVFETEKAVVVRVEVAGVRNADLRVSVERDLLCVRGVRSQPSTSEDVLRHHQLEIEQGPFEARVRLPAVIERSQVAANLEEGVLTVRMPKRAPRRIEVQRSSDEDA